LSRIFWIGNGVPSFVAGDIGQRIILKSGLLPVRMPGRNIIKSNVDIDKTNDNECEYE
jgi:phosphate transport system substrate-binding protein